MAFKRYKGFIGALPQKFIDSQLPICPLCGHKVTWTLEQKFSMEGIRFRYLCKHCRGILSVKRKDVVKFNDNEVLILKPKKDREEFIPYIGIESKGKSNSDKLNEGYQYSLKDIKDLVDDIKKSL